MFLQNLYIVYSWEEIYNSAVKIANCKKQYNNNLKLFLYTDVTLVVGVMKIDGGTGGPARLIAMWDDGMETSAGHGLRFNPLIVLFIILLFTLFI